MGLFNGKTESGVGLFGSGDSGDLFSGLEPRLMMAGDVSAVLAGANLMIRGDAEDNGVRIVEGETPGSVLVEGLDGTTINGEESATFDRVRQNIKVDLKKGADTLEVVDLDLKGNLMVNTGNGDDIVDISGSDIGKMLSVKFGKGETKSVSISETDIGKNLSIKDKAGATTAELNDLDVGNKAQIKLGGGDDILGVFGSTFRKGAVMHLGGGADEAWIEDNTFSKRSLLHGGGGDDGVTEDIETLNDISKGSKLRHFESVLGLAEDDGPFDSGEEDPPPAV